MALTLRTEVGGLGGTPTDMVDAVTAIAAVCGSTSMIYLMHIAASVVTAGPGSRVPNP